MPKRSRKSPAADFNQMARRIVDQATGEPAAKPAKKKAVKKKDPAAVALGRKGGLKGGPARATGRKRHGRIIRDRRQREQGMRDAECLRGVHRCRRVG
jgi:hypothetical protein